MQMNEKNQTSHDLVLELILGILLVKSESRMSGKLSGTKRIDKGRNSRIPPTPSANYPKSEGL